MAVLKKKGSSVCKEEGYDGHFEVTCDSDSRNLFYAGILLSTLVRHESFGQPLLLEASWTAASYT